MSAAAAQKATTGKITKAANAQVRLNKAEDAATQAALKRDAATLEAQEAGATYDQLEAALTLSTSRVTQILRRARKRRDTA